MQKQAYTKMGRQELRADIIANLPEKKTWTKVYLTDSHIHISGLHLYQR